MSVFREAARELAQMPKNELGIPDAVATEEWKEEARSVFGAQFDSILWTMITDALPQGHWYDLSANDFTAYRENTVSGKTRRLIEKRQFGLLMLSKKMVHCLFDLGKSIQSRDKWPQEADKVKKLKRFCGKFVRVIPQAYHGFWFDLIDGETPRPRQEGPPTIYVTSSPEFAYLCKGASLYDGKSEISFSHVLGVMADCASSDRPTSACSESLHALHAIFGKEDNPEHNAFAADFSVYLQKHADIWQRILHQESSPTSTSDRALSTIPVRRENNKRQIIDLSSTQGESTQVDCQVPPSPMAKDMGSYRSVTEVPIEDVNPETTHDFMDEISVFTSDESMSGSPVGTEIAVSVRARSCQSKTDSSHLDDNSASPCGGELANSFPNMIVPRDNLSRCLDALICGVCNNIRREPHTSTKCGHMFCAACWDSWLEQNESCPLCREKVRKANLIRIIV